MMLRLITIDDSWNINKTTQSKEGCNVVIKWTEHWKTAVVDKRDLVKMEESSLQILEAVFLLF